jgi:MFS family permease
MAVFKLKYSAFFICFSASLFFFYQFIQGNMFPSIADNLMHEFHISATQMSYLSSAYYFSNVIFLFISGYILDHYSVRRTMLLAMLISVLSTFVFATTSDFYLAFICRLFSGMSSAFCFIGPIRVASRLYPAKRMAMITGLIVTFAMTGGILSQYPLTQLVLSVGWREGVNWIGFLGLVLWVLMSIGLREAKEEQLSSKKTVWEIITALKVIYTNPLIIRASLYTSLMNMVVAVFGAMMGTMYLMQRLSIAKPSASFINSMLFFGAIVGGPSIGWLSDKLGLRVLPMKVSAVIALFLILIALYAPLTAFDMGGVFFLLGLITAAQVISYGWVAEHSPPHQTAMAVSAISVMTQGGYVLYQNIYSFILVHCSGKVTSFYPLQAYQIAALIMPVGLGLAYLMMSGLYEHKDKDE